MFDSKPMEPFYPNISMRNLLIISLALFLSAASCRKKTYQAVYTPAIITGIDYRKCMCCGGPMITFSDTTTPYAATYKLVTNNWEELGITDSTVYPVKVFITYRPDADRCNGQFITITGIKK